MDIIEKNNLAKAFGRNFVAYFDAPPYMTIEDEVATIAMAYRDTEIDHEVVIGTNYYMRDNYLQFHVASLNPYISGDINSAVDLANNLNCLEGLATIFVRDDRRLVILGSMFVVDQVIALRQHDLLMESIMEMMDQYFPLFRGLVTDINQSTEDWATTFNVNCNLYGTA